MRTCCWHSCGGKIHQPFFIPTATAETGCCLLLSVTVFHAEPQVLIKKATFTTNIHLSYAEIKLQFELTAHKNLLSFFQEAKDNQKELTYTCYQRQIFFFQNYIFLISVTQKITIQKACLTSFHSGLKWSRRGLSKKAEILEICIPSKAQIYMSTSSDKNSKLPNEVNFIITDQNSALFISCKCHSRNEHRGFQEKSN